MSSHGCQRQAAEPLAQQTGGNDLWPMCERPAGRETRSPATADEREHVHVLQRTAHNMDLMLGNHLGMSKSRMAACHLFITL